MLPMTVRRHKLSFSWRYAESILASSRDAHLRRIFDSKENSISTINHDDGYVEELNMPPEKWRDVCTNSVSV